VLGAVYYALSYPSIAQAGKELAADYNLTRLFENHYRMQIAEGDEFLLSIWNRVMPRLQLAMAAVRAGFGLCGLGFGLWVWRLALRLEASQSAPPARHGRGARSAPGACVSCVAKGVRVVG
jgi:hypothetical protein